MKKVLPKHGPQAPLDSFPPVQNLTTGTATFAGIDPDGLYTTRQAAVITGMTVSFYEARRAKELPPRFMSLGRSVKYLGLDLIAFLKGGYQVAGGDHE